MRTRILAISGSLRAASSNASVLLATSLIGSPEVEVAIYRGLADLPHFNPDLDVDPLPAAVAEFCEQIRRADALLICSPEYAHGIPGALKNALDWLVSGPEIIGMPVASISASLRADGRGIDEQRANCVTRVLPRISSPPLPRGTGGGSRAAAVGRSRTA